MTVGELKKLIHDLDDNREVRITCLDDLFYKRMKVVKVEFTEDGVELSGEVD